MGFKFNLDPANTILLKRNLAKNGKAQKFLTSEVRRLSDPYTPFDKGMLKNNVTVADNQIIYKSPYAKKNYYGNGGYGNQGTSKGGLRGKMWVNRMIADNGKELIKSVAEFVGGRPK